ncbi:serine protease inhibitor Kazal-type 6-like [Pogona vitticeps]
MKMTIISVILPLAISCFFLGTGASGKKIDCSEYQIKKHPIVCPKYYFPLCGTDGVTYGNECFLCAKILEGAKIDLAHKGECVDCSQYPQPQKKTPGDCPNAYIPVCGTDNKTYPHVCILCAKISTTGKQIGILHKGECTKQKAE